MLSPQTQDASTKATMVIDDPGPFQKKSALPSYKSTYEFIDTVGFTYSSDPTIIGDPFTIAIPNPKGDYTNSLLIGARVKLFLENPHVKGGIRTHKQTGVIVRRRSESNSQGTVLYLECADLGWHLLNNDAPLWSNLTKPIPIAQLLKRKGWIEPSWGIKYDPRYDNLTNRNLKLSNARAGLLIEMNPDPFTPLPRIQVEPGDKIADILVTYARRQNAFINVNIEGHIQFWNPDYKQRPIYTFEYHPPGTPRSSLNNVLDTSLEEDLTTRWSEVTCVGELITPYIPSEQDLLPLDINATKTRGTIQENQKKTQDKIQPVPFLHRLIFSDGEIYDDEQSRRLAKWRYERGIYDSWKLTYLVKGHYQLGPYGGTWFEADTMCEVNDEVNGVYGLHYVSAVNYTRNENGDQTQIVLRKPEFLTPYFTMLSSSKKKKKKHVLSKAKITPKQH